MLQRASSDGLVTQWHQVELSTSNPSGDMSKNCVWLCSKWQMTPVGPLCVRLLGTSGPKNVYLALSGTYNFDLESPQVNHLICYQRQNDTDSIPSAFRTKKKRKCGPLADLDLWPLVI